MLVKLQKAKSFSEAGHRGGYISCLLAESLRNPGFENLGKQVNILICIMELRSQCAALQETVILATTADACKINPELVEKVAKLSESLKQMVDYAPSIADVFAEEELDVVLDADGAGNALTRNFGLCELFPDFDVVNVTGVANSGLKRCTGVRDWWTSTWRAQFHRILQNLKSGCVVKELEDIKDSLLDKVHEDKVTTLLTRNPAYKILGMLCKNMQEMVVELENARTKGIPTGMTDQELADAKKHVTLGLTTVRMTFCLFWIRTQIHESTNEETLVAQLNHMNAALEVNKLKMPEYMRTEVDRVAACMRKQFNSK